MVYKCRTYYKNKEKQLTKYAYHYPLQKIHPMQIEKEDLEAWRASLPKTDASSMKLWWVRYGRGVDSHTLLNIDQCLLCKKLFRNANLIKVKKDDVISKNVESDILTFHFVLIGWPVLGLAQYEISVHAKCAERHFKNWKNVFRDETVNSRKLRKKLCKKRVF